MPVTRSQLFIVNLTNDNNYYIVNKSTCVTSDSSSFPIRCSTKRISERMLYILMIYIAIYIYTRKYSPSGLSRGCG